ncbi:hypothetical protein FACS1894178_7330 [Bacteroidia bacterium]|nr:hypothetical protein FACS1894178_7330 [Bacteroidia bacterium]
MYDLVLITTFQNFDHIGQLSASLERNKNVKIFCILINQTIDKHCNNCQNVAQLFSEKTSLSHARNIGLQYLEEKNMDYQHIMFPDDDAFFDENFFENYKNVVEINKNYLINVLSPDRKEWVYGLKKIQNSMVKKSNFDAAISINMLVSRNVMRKVGFFDEHLGVGTENFAGEDTDFFLKIYEQGNCFETATSLTVIHPSHKDKIKTFTVKKLKNEAKKYSKGLIFVLKKHKISTFYVCFKAFAGFLYHLLKFNFKTSLSYFYLFIFRVKYAVISSSCCR